MFITAPAPSLTPCRLWSWPFDGKPVPGCGQSLQRGWPVPEAAHWICVSMYQAFRQIGPVQPFPLQQGPAPIFWPRAPWIHAWAALLSLQRYGMLGETTPDHRPWLLIRDARKTQLSDADEELQSRLHLQVSTREPSIRGWGKKSQCTWTLLNSQVGPWILNRPLEKVCAFFSFKLWVFFIVSS